MKLVAKAWSALAVGAALSVAACASAPAAPAPASVQQVVSTTSFGMCVGYCTTRLEIADGRAVLVREARGGRGGPSNLPEQRFEAALSASEWQAISQAAAHALLGGLPDVIGCPDCADGGAESLTITDARGGRTVTFDHGADIAQAHDLLVQVRALRERLMPEG